MANDSRFTPGMPVWVIERDADGAAQGVSGYIFIAHVECVVILSSYVNDFDFYDILAYHVQCTVEEYDTDLCVFPDEDCFISKDACNAAFNAELEVR